ncbi:MAG: TetR/AcrR family transcriptional regulator [Oscillospiraceae bacterium]|nr:TetR/AcrR family transcriptional regulator [Oscillospiraceae bacterium]
MVHDTFSRLPEEKKHRILSAARKEFLANPFEKSSINRILEEAAVPKGSFYQYFDSKEDLFYLCIYSIAETLLQLRQKNGQTLLGTGLLRIEKLGYKEGMQQYMGEVLHYLSREDLDLYQRLIDAPSSVRNFLMTELSAKLLSPVLAIELSNNPNVRKDIDVDYIAYLISMSEVIAMDYGTRHGMDSIGMLKLSYIYLQAIYESIRKEKPFNIEEPDSI